MYLTTAVTTAIEHIEHPRKRTEPQRKLRFQCFYFSGITYSIVKSSNVFGSSLDGSTKPSTNGCCDDSV